MKGVIIIIFVPPDIFTPIATVFMITMIAFGLMKPLKRKRAAILTILCISIIVGVVQLGFHNELESLERGEVLALGFILWEEEVTIPPTVTYTSPQLSNWYTLFNLTIYVETSSSQVVVSLIDSENPAIEYFRGTYSNSNQEFRLPYLHSASGSTANWTFHFYNPSNENIVLEYYIHSGVEEDAGVFEITYAVAYYNLPVKLLVSFYISAGLTAVISFTRNLTKKSSANLT